MKSLIFTYLLTYGGAGAALFNPYVGFLIYVCFAILRPELLWFYSLPAGSNFSRIIAIALLIGWLLRGFGRWQCGKGNFTIVMLVGFWCWNALGALIANTPQAMDSVEALSKVVLPFLAGITLVDSAAKLRQLIWVIILSAGYFAYEANLRYYEALDIQSEGFAGFGNGGLSITMLTTTGLAFFWGLQCQGWWRKLLAFGSAALMAHVVLFSFSRGAMLGMIAMAATALFYLPKKPTYYISFVAALVVVFMLAGPSVRQRFATIFVDTEERDESAQSRLELWSNCFDCIGRRPIFGLGPSGWPLVAREYGWPEGKEAHCLWLQIAAELGIPGLLLLGSFYLVSAKRLWQFSRHGANTLNPLCAEFATLVIPSIVGFLVAAQFVTCGGLECPYYVVLVGTAALKLFTAPDQLAETRDSSADNIDLSRHSTYGRPAMQRHVA